MILFPDSFYETWYNYFIQTLYGLYFRKEF